MVFHPDQLYLNHDLASRWITFKQIVIVVSRSVYNQRSSLSVMLTVFNKTKKLIRVPISPSHRGTIILANYACSLCIQSRALKKSYKVNYEQS